MADVTREVETKFTFTEVGGGVLNNLAGQARNLVGSFTSLPALVMGGVAAIGAGGLLSSIIEVNNRAEQMRLALGGMFQAFGYSSTFAGGMDIAAASIERIERAAGALPGEADDYLEVFRGSFAAMEDSARATLDTMDLSIIGSNATDSVGRMTDLANSVTALGVTWGQSSTVIGRQFSLMLAGRAGLGTTLLRNMLPYMRQVEGQANLTALGFRNMTAPQRVRVIVGAISKLSPMLQASATSFDAMSGSLTTTLKQLLRSGSSPFFEAIKTTIGRVNSLIIKFTPLIVQAAQALSTSLAGALDALYARLLQFMNSGSFGRMAEMFERMKGRVGGLLAGPGGGTGAAMVATGYMAGGPLMGLVTAVVGEFARNAQLLSSFLTQLAYVGSELWITFTGMVMAIGSWGEAVGGFLANALVGVTEAVGMVVEGISYFLDPLFRIASDIYTGVKPALDGLGTAFGMLWVALAANVMPIFANVGIALNQLWDVVGNYVVRFLREFVGVIADVVSGLARMGRFLGLVTVGAMPSAGGAGGTIRWSDRSTFQGGGEGLMSSIRNALAGAGAGQRRPTTPEARSGHQTHNDFRYSRFDISQKFAEGFDPDRIAVAFVRDIEQMADRRLQSGFEPLFALP